MFYYRQNGGFYCSLEELALPRVSAPEEEVPLTYLFRAPAENRRSAFSLTDPRQLALTKDLDFLDLSRAGQGPDLTPVANRLGRMRAVNVAHPQWRRAAERGKGGKKRLHILAIGDVGSTLLTGLKLLGGDVLSAIGICDLDEKTTARWEFEMNQVTYPWDYDALPPVEVVSRENLFQCDVFVFVASKGIPPVGSGVRDVRMAQFEANRPLVESFARQARAAHFGGLFMVLSDPVDPLCKAAYLASNRDCAGNWDGLGLLPEQIQGFGLGVMTARAAYFAKQDPRFASFLTEGRAFGPHGQGLVVANSIEHYDDVLSRELTELVETANLRIRDLGFKPYVAPAVSSGAMQLLLTLRGDWHCSSVCLGGVWFGVKNRFTHWGVETEALALPEALFGRLRETERQLAEII